MPVPPHDSQTLEQGTVFVPLQTRQGSELPWLLRPEIPLPSQLGQIMRPLPWQSMHTPLPLQRGQRRPVLVESEWAAAAFEKGLSSVFVALTLGV